jgi:hypothetical protein
MIYSENFGFVTPVVYSNDPDEVSARRIKRFFNLGPAKLDTPEELETARLSLGALPAVIPQLELPGERQAELLDRVPHITNWLCGAPTRKVSEDLGIPDTHFDAIRKSAMESIGSPLVYETLRAQTASSN